MQTVVVGTDGSPNADAAVHEAAKIAKSDGATLHLVAAYPSDAAYGERIPSGATREPINLRDVAEQMLARAEADLEEQGIQVVTDAREGEPANAILDVAREQDADMIVIGARGVTGLRRFWLGGVASKLAHHADRSLMIVREKPAVGA